MRKTHPHVCLFHLQTHHHCWHVQLCLTSSYPSPCWPLPSWHSPNSYSYVAFCLVVQSEFVSLANILLLFSPYFHRKKMSKRTVDKPRNSNNIWGLPQMCETHQSTSNTTLVAHTSNSLLISLNLLSLVLGSLTLAQLIIYLIIILFSRPLLLTICLPSLLPIVYKQKPVALVLPNTLHFLPLSSIFMCLNIMTLSSPSLKIMLPSRIKYQIGHWHQMWVTAITLSLHQQLGVNV